MRRISLDFETRSRCDIRKHGAYRYAEDPSTEVLVMALREDDGPMMSWDASRPLNGALALLWEAIEMRWEIHAFNSQFEWCILKHVCPRQFGTPIPDINRLRCTQAVCRRAGLRASLEKAGEDLGLPIRKDKAGAALIRKFSIPQKDGRFIEWDDDVSFTVMGETLTAAEAFRRFVDYCEQDVRTEMAVAEAMRRLALKDIALDGFLLTARLNDRGVPVDVKALRHAMALYEERERELGARYRRLTGLSPTQTVKSLEWMRANGYRGHSLDKASRAAYGEDEGMTEGAREALAIKGELSFAAVKKIPAMLDWVMNDGRIRGSFKWCGAQKTWRWTSEGPQWQNMKKPPKRLRPRIEEAYRDVAEGMDLELFSMSYGNPYEVIASLARYFVRFPDRDIFDTDYSSVEARILPALIECDRIMEKFTTGEDIYIETAEELGRVLREKFEVPFEIDRDTSKTVTLATQFQGGWHAVFTATGQTWKREWCEAAAAVVRKQNPEFGKAWRAFQDAFVRALDRPREWINATRFVAFAYLEDAPFPRMLMRLPSGRAITMPRPEKEPQTLVKVVDGEEHGWEALSGHVEDEGVMAQRLSLGAPFRPKAEIERWFHSWDLSYWGHLEGVNYGRVKTYGGSCLQSATQGTGVDLLTHGVLRAEERGFEPFFLVHDQCLVPAEGDVGELTEALCDVPEWFQGFPLEAETETVRSYCKS